MKVEEVSPPSSDNEDEPKEEPKEKAKEQPTLPSEEPDEEAVEEPAASLKKKKNTLRTLPPIKIPVSKK
jgi:hypothetical protein